MIDDSAALFELMQVVQLTGGPLPELWPAVDRNMTA